MVRSVSLVPLALCAVLAPPASAQQRLPAPAWVQSVEVTRPGTTIRSRPTTAASRRGTVRVGTRMPFLGRLTGEGCPGGEWIQVGAEAFVCETLVRFNPSQPGGDEVPLVPEGSLTPRIHAFVRTDGTWAYSRPEDYFRDQMTESLGRGFGVAIVERRSVGGVDMARTLSGLWVVSSELRFANPSDFFGVELEEGDDPTAVAWVTRNQATLRSRPGGPVEGRGSRLTRVSVVETRGDWLRTADEVWIHRRDVARARRAARPQGVGEAERWIDVDTTTQTLTAMVGDRAVFVTAVSTGRAGSPTPHGTFRIWVKLAEDDMDDLEREDVDENYAIQAVPWVQYFNQSVALHAAFWHDRFGHPQSHGCVNLAPRDAEWLFRFTMPQMPLGWDAILPTRRARGTVVRVR